MDYAALYQKKLTSAAEAVKVVKSGDWVDYGWCTNHPYTLDKALAARQNELKDVKVRGGVTMWMPEICKAEDAGEHFTWNSWHCSGIDRKIISKGVDIGGVDGMVHISELSWSRIKNPAEVVSIGDHLDVYVISFDPEKRKISLGVKDRTQNPWDVFMNTYKVGDVANVRIVKLMTFGAFAEVVPGVDGLIHISQIADRRIDKPSDVLSEGQMVDAKITAIDEEKKKISLSIRALLSGEEEAPVEE